MPKKVEVYIYRGQIERQHSRGVCFSAGYTPERDETQPWKTAGQCRADAIKRGLKPLFLMNGLPEEE